MHGALLLSSKVSKEIDPANPNFLWGSTLGGKKEKKKKERKEKGKRIGFGAVQLSSHFKQKIPIS